MKQVLFHCPRNIITSPPGWQPLLYNRCFYITMNALNELMICCLTKSARHAWKLGEFTGENRRTTCDKR